jgi:hypothetical protein
VPAPITGRPPRRFVQVGFELPPDDLEALKDIARRKRTTVARLLANGVADTLRNEGIRASPDLAQVGQRPRGRPRGPLIDYRFN